MGDIYTNFKQQAENSGKDEEDCKAILRTLSQRVLECH